MTDVVGNETARGGESIQVACFFVGEEEYALDIMRIKEIINPVDITAIPRTPEFMEGIIELRGAFLPVIDVRKRFGLVPRDRTRDTKYIVVSLEGRILGLIVDRVAEVKRIHVEDISDAPDFSAEVDATFFDGVIKFEGRIVMILNLDAILSQAEKSQLRGIDESGV